ncbi:uncharacterized protein LOC125661507 isoform X2 [Ostrea edulis]|uniref:uncharacterized protein LOC125661507 isoform X2 n=1 Tax=Ostrea edulis TaxID=37623 RepID=UPI0024AF1627|nr:uncharacterized protein LOC125661507 isoform X2 [Ostrea edulis]
MGPIRLKYILLMFIFSHHIDLTISATTNDKLLVAAGIVTAALMSSSYGYYSWTPSVIALLTAILLLTLIPTQSDADANGVVGAVIQGSRVTSSDPWLTDSGQPLPYITSIQGIANVAGQTKLLALNTGLWQPFNPAGTSFQNAVCEI